MYERERWAGYGDVVVYPMWPVINHPQVPNTSVQIVFGAPSVYVGPDEVTSEPPSLNLRPQLLPEPSPQSRIVSPTPASLAKDRAERAAAAVEQARVLRDFHGTCPPLPSLPLEVDVCSVKGKPPMYLGVEVAAVAVAGIADSKGQPVPRADLRYAWVWVHVLLLGRGWSSERIERGQVIARRIGWMAATWKTNPADY